MEEEKLRQLFKNRANCYADAEDVIQAMDEECFIETIKEALSQHDVIKSICEKCGSKSFVHSKKQNKEICLDCWENEQTVL
jgi:hypothetical protein